TLPASLH
ncbi:thiol reductant ABC exporter, CydC subunit, partial [Vibrio cholerae O1 str. EC-0012]